MDPILKPIPASPGPHQQLQPELSEATIAADAPSPQENPPEQTPLPATED